MKLFIFVSLFAHLNLVFSKLAPDQQKGTIKEFLKTFKEGVKDEDGKFSLANFADELILDGIPVLWGQKPSNIQGKFEHYKGYLTEDHSNDEIGRAGVETIANRSGYKVEKHRVVASDGYITTLFRIINPLVDPKKLRQPPLMVMHGGFINAASFVISSSKQHHPEKWPRNATDGPITSWNRSIGFTFANHGYDVWLVGTRGSDIRDQGRVPFKELKNFEESASNHTLGERLVKLQSSLMYWRYSFDDIIDYEVPKQIETILNVTGAQKINLIAYSYATTITLSLFTQRADMANKINSYIVMAPMINTDSCGHLTELNCKIIRKIPLTLGTLLTLDTFAAEPLHYFLLLGGEVRRLRYSIIKLLLNLFLGSSGKYRTLYEPAVLGHLAQPLSFKQLQHACQQARARRYQRYDYGYLMNKFVHGTFKPPFYDISHMHVKNWMLISAEYDNYGCQSSIKQILEQVNPKPLQHLQVKGYNHYDLLAGVDVDKQVVMPLLQFMDRFTYTPQA